MITIIFGPPRIGKTALLVHFLNESAFDSERNYLMRSAINELNQNDFKLSYPMSCVSSNFDLKLIKQGFTPLKSRFINPFLLGFANDEVETHFNFPYETIGIMEAQKYYNSRNFKNFRDWQSRYYEQHGHLKINILMDTQRPGLIDVNIRALANFIEVRKLDIKQDKNGFFESAIWTVRSIDNAGLLDRYLQSGNTLKEAYKEYQIITSDNVFELYDSFNCKAKFFAGHFNSDYDLNYGISAGKRKSDFEKYLKTYDDEIPAVLKKGK